MSSYTLAQVLAGRRALICARPTDTVAKAVEMMFTNRVAQLPVVDDSGCLRGIVSQQGILAMHFYSDGQADLLRLPVAHCHDPATVMSLQDDLLAAIDQLRTRGVYAVVVTEQDKPVGILTGRDMTHSFRSLFEGMLLLEHIELTLRECVTVAFPDETARRQALLAAFGPGKQNRALPSRGLDHLSFTDMMRLVTADGNWPAFDPLLGPKALFEPLMQRVRLVRNELAHFQGRPDALELDTLHRAVVWLMNRQSAPLPTRRKSAVL